jgi:membrane protease YdiL (CAAX protease family)
VDAPRAAPPALRGRPRWWTPLAICSVSLAVFLTASGVMALVAMFVVHGKLTPDMFQDAESLKAVSQSRLGLFLVVVVPQLFLVLPSILAAILSSVPTRQRLGLVRGHWPVWAWVAAAAATPLVGMVAGLVVGLLLEESDTLKQMTQVFRGHGQNGFLIPLALMIGATPAFCEEILFRGYVQTRLTRSFGPPVGIILASFLFAAFHLDLVHVVAVFPLGLFLGWVTWQSGSLFPAMLGHFVNNAISVIAVVIAPEAEPDVLALPAITFTLAILAAGIIGMAAVSVASVAYRRPDSQVIRSGTQLI